MRTNTKFLFTYQENLDKGHLRSSTNSSFKFTVKNICFIQVSTYEVQAISECVCKLTLTRSVQNPADNIEKVQVVNGLFILAFTKKFNFSSHYETSIFQLWD